MVEKTPNDKFRDVRERTQSQENSEYCLSRQELADRANAWIWEHHGKKYDLNSNYIGKIEQGIIRWPDAVRRAAFRAILKVRKDSELGFVNARARYYGAVVKLSDVDDVKRRKLIETATVGVGALALGKPMVALLGNIKPTPIPRRVGASDIEHIRSVTQVYDSLSRTYGGGVVRETVMTHLRYGAGLLEATCPERLRPELFSAVGALAETAGYTAMDANADAEAHHAFSFALGCAEQAEDWPLRANVLTSMTKQALWTGKPNQALTLAELALVRADDQLTATVRAMLHASRGRVLATMHRVQETLRAIGAADEHFAHSTPDNDPPFMAFYDDASHAQHVGHALVDLAMLGHHPEHAADRLTAAAAGHATEHVRSRATCLTTLATLTMATSDPLHAATIGHEALEVVGGIRSRRTTEALRELSRFAATHQHLEEVEHLRQRIATLLGTEHPEEESSPDPSSIHP